MHGLVKKGDGIHFNSMNLSSSGNVEILVPFSTLLYMLSFRDELLVCLNFKKILGKQTAFIKRFPNHWPLKAIYNTA
jgi:hypothetical protein